MKDKFQIFVDSNIRNARVCCFSLLYFIINRLEHRREVDYRGLVCSLLSTLLTLDPTDSSNVT